LGGDERTLLDVQLVNAVEDSNLADSHITLLHQLKAIEVKGSPKIWADKAENGNTRNRHFLGDCGSYVAHALKRRDVDN
jgi:hypothetical protein